MQKRSPLLIFALLSLTAVTATAGENTLDGLAKQAVSNNSKTASQALESLRAAGPAGLEALMTRYEKEIQASSNLCQRSFGKVEGDCPRTR